MPQSLSEALTNQATPELVPPTEREQAIMGWKARRGAEIRQRAERAQFADALRRGRKVHGGTYPVTLPADLSRSPEAAAAQGTTVDERGREHLLATLPGDCVSDPEAGGRYSPALLMATIRQGVGGAIGKARKAGKLPKLTADERDDLSQAVAVEVWKLAADRLGGLEDRTRLPRFGDLSGTDAEDRNSQRAKDVAWVRGIAANLLAQGADRADRTDRYGGEWRGTGSPVGWQSLDAPGDGEALDGATPLGEALRVGGDLATDQRAEDDPYLIDGRGGILPGHPATLELMAAAALPAGKAGERAIMAALTDSRDTPPVLIAHAGDFLAAEDRPTGKGPRKDWRKSARDGAAKLADLAESHPVGMRALIAGLALIAEDRPTGRHPMERTPHRRAGKVAPPTLPTDGQAERMRRIYHLPESRRDSIRREARRVGRIDRQDALRRLSARPAAPQGADSRAETARLLSADLARLMSEAPGD